MLFGLASPYLQPHYPDELAKLRRDVRLQGLDLLPCASLLEAIQMVLGEGVGNVRGTGKQPPGSMGKRGRGRGSTQTAAIEVLGSAEDEFEGEEPGAEDGDDNELDEEETEEPWEREMARM